MFNTNLFVDFLLALFAFVNPLYTVPVFLGMTQDFSDSERKRTSATAAATMFCAVLLTVIIGDQILLVLGIHVPSFKIAGGLIILVLAFQMLFVAKGTFENPVPETNEKPHSSGRNIGVYPLTIPLLAGPGMFTTSIIFSSRLTTLADFTALLAVAVIIAFQYWISMVFAAAAARYINETTIRIGTRILGILLAAISVELVLSGIADFIHSNFSTN